MKKPFFLLPQPQKLAHTNEEFILPADRVIVIDARMPADLFSIARWTRNALRQYAGVDWTIAGGSAGSADQIGLLINIDGQGLTDQGYHLSINNERIHILAGGLAGTFYALQTLIQLLKQFRHTLPAVEIEDWPDLEKRGVLLDISRTKVPTMETLFSLIDMLSSWKINQLQLYTEHTFAYQNHPQVWANASPITAEEILILDVYCRERYIELVPNQNCFGHMTRWFAHEKYLPLAETKGGFSIPAGSSQSGDLHIEFPHPFSLSPANPGSLEFVDSLFAELLPNFSCEIFNVNCDETFDLGMGMSKVNCDAVGKGRVYLEFLLKIYDLVNTYGRKMQFWADIVGNHPELIPEIPKDVIAMEWGYEAGHPFKSKSRSFVEAGIPFYVCPGTSSWNSLGGRVDNAIENIKSAVENGIKFNASGMLVTDWGDNGHWQQLPISYPGLVYAAGVSWAYEANREIDLSGILDKFVFEDQSGTLGQAILDLGNLYQQTGLQIPNNSILFWGFRIPLNRVGDQNIQQQINLWTGEQNQFIDRMYETLAINDQISSSIRKTQCDCPDASLIEDEMDLTTRMIHHAGERLLTLCGVDSYSRSSLDIQLEDIQVLFHQTWLARNRPGGLDESIMYMDGNLSPPDMPTWESLLHRYAQIGQN